MSEQGKPAGRRHRTWWWIAGVALLGALAVAIQLGGGDPVPTGTGSPTDASPAVTSEPTGNIPTTAPPDVATEPAISGSVEPGSPAAPTSVATLSLDGEGTLAQSVTARVVTVEAVQGVAVQPGEVGGPALRVTIEVSNKTADVLDMRSAVVNLYYGPDDTPATPLSAPGVEPFPLSAGAGASVTARLVFAVPDGEARDRVRVEVDLARGGTVLVFEGVAPR